MWHTLAGSNKEITLSFMRVGHTCRMVDACFGFLKQRYRSSECDTMEHLQAVVQASAKCNSAQRFEGKWREWDKFLSLNFKPPPGISQMQHLFFTRLTRYSNYTHKYWFHCVSISTAKKEVKATSFSADNLPPIWGRKDYLKIGFSTSWSKFDILFDLNFRTAHFPL